MENTKPKKYSYSELDTYETCPHKYLLKYIEKKYPEDSSAIALEVGTLIHSTEEKIANTIISGRPINYDELIDKVIASAERIRNKFPTDWEAKDKSDRTYTEKFYYYCKDGIHRLENFIKANPNIEIIAAEQHFEFEYDGRIYRGSIDRVLRDKNTGKYIIQDIKTYPVPFEDGTDGKDKDDHLITPLQFVTYVMGASKLYNLSEDMFSCQYDLPFCDKVQDAGTAGFMERGRQRIQEIHAGIAKGDFVPSQQFLCYWCEYCAANPNAPEDTKYCCPFYSNWNKKNTRDFSRRNKWQGMEKLQEAREKYAVDVQLEQALKEAFKI